LKTIYNKLIY